MKITFIGAGSTVFAKNVLGDTMLCSALWDAEFALYDIDARGITPCAVGALPLQLAAMNSSNIYPQLLTIEAARTGKRDLIYQAAMMAIVVGAMWARRALPRFHWSWAIPLVTILLTIADMAYFVALSREESMVAVVSMIRRSSVVVSFACGAILFGEKNLRAKALDLVFILIGMIFLWLGSR